MNFFSYKKKEIIRTTTPEVIKKERFFDMFNTTEAYCSKICFIHLEEGECTCVTKDNLGKVRSLKTFYEKIADREMASKKLAQIPKRNIEPYKLDPNVKKLAALFDEIVKQKV
ncbi:hypothetical protein TCON_1531 [Astathelohania contejeani]|uniref:LAGLIDADG homing endonuclease n=1 Tax=Astathelohania contejeani TaxID=164912 RepID=A0ABQ7HYM0_9MICR|nr:hypothetical protein TCON_1531 [Thelohania contejeani]